MDGKAIGARVRALRLSRVPRLSQEDLGHEAGVTRLTIGNLESGKTLAPDLTTLQGIAKVYEVDIRWLLEGDAQSNEPMRDDSVPALVPYGSPEDMQIAAKRAGLSRAQTDRFMSLLRQEGPEFPLEALISIARALKESEAGQTPAPIASEPPSAAPSRLETQLQRRIREALASAGLVANDVELAELERFAASTGDPDYPEKLRLMRVPEHKRLPDRSQATEVDLPPGAMMARQPKPKKR